MILAIYLSMCLINAIGVAFGQGFGSVILGGI